MLKLDNQAFRRFNVRDVKFAALVPTCNFLPIWREVVLPIAVPLSLIFPSVITVSLTLVRPVPHFLRSASDDEVRITSGAFALCSRHCFYAQVVMDSKPNSYVLKLSC